MQHGVGRLAQDPDQRRGQREECAHGRRYPERRAFRVAEREALRHELADHDMEEGQEQIREDDREQRRHVGVERLRERVLAERTDTERGERDAELHRRDELRRVARDPQHRAGAAVALVVELDDARAPRGDERVLGRDEEAVEQHEQPDGKQLESECHAPDLQGVGTRREVVHQRVSEYRRRSGRPRFAAPGRATTSRSRWDSVSATAKRRWIGGERRPEEIVRDLVAGARLAAERGLGAVEPVGVVVGDRRAARRRIGDGYAVAAVRDARRELGDEPERVEVVAERVGPALGIEPDRGRDRREERVARDQRRRRGGG